MPKPFKTTSEWKICLYGGIQHLQNDRLAARLQWLRGRMTIDRTVAIEALLSGSAG